MNTNDTARMHRITEKTSHRAWSSLAEWLTIRKDGRELI